jgi:F0F1-type ATP synthase epsilon subunit
MSDHSKNIHVFIRNREKVLFDEDIQSISSRNEKGIFDILPLHGNFISLIEQRLILVRNDGTKTEVQVSNGILRASENRVEVFIGVHQ